MNRKDLPMGSVTSTLEYMKGFACQHDPDCDTVERGAICNSCWARKASADMLPAVQRLQRIEAMARALVEKLDIVHENEKYRGVWAIAQLHNGPYTGPQYKTELDQLRELTTE